MPQAFYIAFGAAFTVAVAIALGKLLLRGLHLRFYRQEETLFAFVSGAAILHLIVFALLTAQIARKGVFLAAGAAILAFAIRKGVHRPRGASLPPLPKPWQWMFGIVFAIYCFLYLSNAMAPEMSPDGSGYHLGLVARYLREHGFPRITTNMYANLSEGIEMLYVFAFAFGRHSAAATVHLAFTIALPLLMLAHARRNGFPVAGAGGALFCFLSPVVGVDGTSAYIDVAVTCVIFTVYSLVHIWLAERQPRLLIPIGLVCGYTYAAKYTAFLAVPYALALIGWKLWKIGRPILRPLATVTAFAVLMMAPWLVKNWIVVGNPFSPFANRWFPNPNVRISFEKEYIRQMRDYQIKDRSKVPIDVTVYGGMLSGMVGPLFVLTPLSLFALRWPAGRRLVFAGILFFLPYFSNIGTRFLLPSLPFFSLAMAMVFAQSKAVLPYLIVVHALLSWPHVLRIYASEFCWRLQRIPVAAALRISKEEDYLALRMPDYATARMLETFTPPGARIFAFSGLPEAYTTREILTGYQAGFNNVLNDTLWTAIWDVNLAPKGRQEFRFPKQSLLGFRVRQSATGTDQWSLNEVRVRLNGAEVPRSPQWRLRASPNPWDIQLAFDNNPVTRWRTWEAIRPGMWIEVDFTTPVTADAVLLEITRDQWQTKLALDGRLPNGTWTPLAPSPNEDEVPPMRGLRRAAIEEFQRRGIHYLLIHDSDPGADDFLTKSRVWGLTELAQRGDARIYQITLGEPSTP